MFIIRHHSCKIDEYVCGSYNPMLYIPVYSCIGPCKAINSPVDKRFVNNFPPCIADADGYLISNSVKNLGKYQEICLINVSRRILNDARYIVKLC